MHSREKPCGTPVMISTPIRSGCLQVEDATINNLVTSATPTAPKDLVTKRDRWLSPESASETELKKRTLTNLYNERPTWLDLAHKALDDAVLDAYGWPHDLTDDDILERLLVLNLERAGASTSPKKGI